MKISCPSPEEVERYFEQWEKDSAFGYKKTDESLNGLFTQAYSLNADVYGVLAKIFALNSAYGTQIPSPCFILLAERIVRIGGLDNGLKDGDLNVVNEISKVIEYKNGRGENRRHTPYSFTTKYASFHNPEKYPIYDSNVQRALIYFRDNCSLPTFTNAELRVYTSFVKVIESMRVSFKLGRISLRKLDKYLYRVGKEV